MDGTPRGAVAARRRRHAARLVALVAAAIAATGAVEVAIAGHGPAPSSEAQLRARCDRASTQLSSLAELRNELLCLHNAERAKHGRAALARNAALERAAQKHVDDTVARDYFTHVSPEGVTPSQRAQREGYNGGVAENIRLVCYPGRHPTPYEVFEFWLGSAGHHSTLLAPRHQHIGIGVARDRDGCTRAVAKFGEPPSSPGTPLPGGGRLIRGGSGNDRLIGTAAADIIQCGAGDDTVDARGGNDVIDCGAGNDVIAAGSGNDRVRGGSGRDRIRGQDGRDRVRAGSGRDRLQGNAGPDRLAGGSAGDRIRGGTGRDRLFGNAGNDRLAGGPARDRLFGGSGRDVLLGGSGRDLLRGGPGRDRARQ